MGEPRPLGHLVAALSAHADVASMTEVLTATLAELLPPQLVRVEYQRSVTDRFAGRPGQPVLVTVTTGERELSLSARPGGGTQATITRSVRGVVISRASVPIQEWITVLAAELDRLAEADEHARAALNRLLLG